MAFWHYSSMSLFYFYGFSMLAILALQSDAVVVPTTIIKSAIAQGAVCLDGSPPAYNWNAGKGDGANNWVVYLQGAGWCLNSSLYDAKDNSTENCASRANRDLGSSHHMKSASFKHVINNNSNETYFYNWNRVVVRYCDGGSFSGDADKPDSKTKLYYRGARIFRVVIKPLMAKGMRNAKNVLLAGGSSGGLGVMIHCDYFRRQFSENVRVKCHADSSLFLQMRDPLRAKFFNTVFGSVVGVQNPEKVLPAKCISEMSALECFFPQNLLLYIKSPIFILNPAFDSFQVRNTFSEDLHDQILNHTVISRSDMALLQDFRKQIIEALPPQNARNGYLITSIFGHSLGPGIGYKGHMFADKKSKSFESAILDWFFDRAHVHLIDPANEPFVVKL